jgi:hypothetical protein
MKRKNLFIIISIAVFITITFLIWWLLGRHSKLNEEHISMNFEIHNCSAAELNNDLLRSNFLKPLLEYSVVKEDNGLENLYLTSISCSDVSFSIPAIGINSLRYNATAASLKESSMTATSRESDEESFFNSWDAEGFAELEALLLKGNFNHKENKGLAFLSEIIESEGDESIPDSIIIDKNCQIEQPPYLFSSAANARKFINEELEKNTNAIYENGKKGDIHIYIWCGDGYNSNPGDRDNDGVANAIQWQIRLFRSPAVQYIEVRALTAPAPGGTWNITNGTTFQNTYSSFTNVTAGSSFVLQSDALGNNWSFYNNYHIEAP